jgi:uncharacterized repeat protein (TIGR03803 family)
MKKQALASRTSRSRLCSFLNQFRNRCRAFISSTLAVTALAGLFAVVNPSSAQAQVIFQNLYSFPAWTATGAGDQSGLVQGIDGNFYGTTEVGGDYHYGTVFQMTPSGAVTNLVSFNVSNGSGPTAGLVQGADGNLYGTTYAGGTSNGGTVFRITTSGTLTTLVSFKGTNGEAPESALVQGSDGNFYGTTVAGEHNAGTVFTITTNGILTTLVAFEFTNGSSPESALVQGTDGNFYGTTSWGGVTSSQIPQGMGTVFRVTTNGTLTTLVAFDDTNGYYPQSALVQGSDGNFYGTTYSGGAYDYGTVFTMTPSGTLSRLASFDLTNGANPFAGLVQGSDGNLYGTTESGGANDAGTIFRITTNGTLTTLVSLQVTNGYFPEATLVQGNDGYFYGTTPYGGANNWGTIFCVIGVLSSGSLQVTICPAGAVNAGAQWEVDGGVCQTNGATVCGLTVGNHTVGFSTVAGWITPASQTVTLISNQTTVATGIYSLEPTLPPVSGCAIFTRPTDTILINGHTLVTNQMTIEAEIQIPSSFTVPSYGSPRILEEQLSGSGDKQFWASPSAVGGSTWVADNQNNGGISLADSMGDDVWHHLAFVHDSNEVREYLDGVQIVKLDFSGDPSIANSPNSVMSIGAFLYTGGGALAQSFIGAVQWVRLSCVARYSGASVTPPVTVPPSDAFTQILLDFSHLAPGTSTVYDLSPNHFTGVAAMGFSGATAPTFVLPAPPAFQTVTQANRSLTLTWSTVPGQIYQIQYTTNLTQASWNDLGYPLVATNGVITVSDTIGNDEQRFYRVVQSQ